MSQQKYLKCECRRCGESIEFPAHGIGLSIPCPHCGNKTTLFAPPISLSEKEATDSSSPNTSEESDKSSIQTPVPVTSTNQKDHGDIASSPTESTRPQRWQWGIAILLLVVVAGASAAWVIYRDRTKTRAAQNSSALSKHSNRPAPAPGSTTASASASASASVPANERTNNPSAESIAAAPTVPKSIEDLKPSDVKLEKAKGSSLVYAVGSLKNESDHQRFGVKLELELTDAGGRKVGTAKDYRSVLEPRQEWHFRAMVLDSKAVSARVANIREDE